MQSSVFLKRREKINSWIKFKNYFEQSGYVIYFVINIPIYLICFITFVVSQVVQTLNCSLHEKHHAAGGNQTRGHQHRTPAPYRLCYQAFTESWKKSPEWPLFPRLIVCMFLHAYYTNLQPLLNVNLSHSLAHSEVFATELLICESIPIVYSEFEIRWNLNWSIGHGISLFRYSSHLDVRSPYNPSTL